MYKVIVGSNLKWKELAYVVLDVEICLNNRPLTYVEVYVELPVITPNLMITGPASRVSFLMKIVGRPRKKR